MGEHLIKWETMCKTKDRGDLGIGNLKARNIILLEKWLWSHFETNSLWYILIESKYGHLIYFVFAPFPATFRTCSLCVLLLFIPTQVRKPVWKIATFSILWSIWLARIKIKSLFYH